MMLAILVLLVLPAQAQQKDDVERAKQLFREGYDFAVEEKWTEALEKLEASRKLIERPSTLFNIGTTLLRLFRPTDAIAAFERYLELASPDDPGRAEANSFLTEARGQLAVVRIELAPSDAQVTIDGRRVDPSQPIYLDPGTRIIAATAAGHDDRRLSIDLAAGETKNLPLQLAAVPPPAPVVVQPEPPPPIAEVLVATAPEEEESFAGSTTFWVLIGVGVAVIGGAIAVAVAVRPQEEEPYPGTLNMVLEGLRTP